MLHVLLILILILHFFISKNGSNHKLSAPEMMRRRNQFFFKPQRYWLCGSSIGKSGSPAMHSKAFGRMKLPYTYQLFDTDDFNK
jgi:hypothetical protein